MGSREFVKDRGTNEETEDWVAGALLTGDLMVDTGGNENTTLTYCTVLALLTLRSPPQGEVPKLVQWETSTLMLSRTVFLAGTYPFAVETTSPLSHSTVKGKSTLEKFII